MGRSPLALVLVCLLAAVGLGAQTIGPMTVIVTPANSLNNLAQPYSQAELIVMFAPNGPFESYMRAASYEAVPSVTSTVLPYATYPGVINHESCAFQSAGHWTTYIGWSAQMVLDAGYALTDHFRRLAFIPSLPCFAGNAGNTWALIAGKQALQTVIHEYLHTLTVGGHAGSQECHLEDGAKVCGTVQQYGDVISPMGRGAGHPSVFEKRSLKWVDGVGTPRMVVAENVPWLYDLEPYDAPLTASGIVALRLNATDGLSWLAIEAHTKPSRSAPAGVVLRRLDSVFEPGQVTARVMLDMDPVTTAFKPMLALGQSYVWDNREITVESFGLQGAVIGVAPCTEAACAEPPPPPPPPPCSGRTCSPPPPPPGRP